MPQVASVGTPLGAVIRSFDLPSEPSHTLEMVSNRHISLFGSSGDRPERPTLGGEKDERPDFESSRDKRRERPAAVG